jgi:RNA-directed DNA polymerase
VSWWSTTVCLAAESEGKAIWWFNYLKVMKIPNEIVEAQWLVGAITDTELFESLFSEQSLYELFHFSFAKTTGKGVDRLNGFQFAMRAADELANASSKCLAGTYRFAPYLEVLKTKGRSKEPRVIGIPIVRDRVILSQLNRFLALTFPERVPRNVASTYVREIAKEFTDLDPAGTSVCSTDIKKFYDSIQRPRLLALLAKRISCKSALSLLGRALLAPTVPKNTKRARHAEFREVTGVPQGLAISNILASIYMEPVDEAMKTGMGVSYYRYVDDVLMFGPSERVHAAFKSLGSRLRLRGLGLHSLTSGKSQIEEFGKPFGYLGYLFDGKKITVRESTIERFIQSIAAKFSDFTHNKARRLQKFSYLTEERLAEIFMMELNERITGAIRGERRYGWIAYFSQINDLSLLHRLDHTIQGLFSRLPEFHHMVPVGLRTIRRAYWEMKFNPRGGYIRDYDRILTRAQKLTFLSDRGRVDPKEALTDEQIDNRYEKYVEHILSAMHADEGAVYG